MSDWLHNLPVLWMALVVFGFTYLLSAAIYALVMPFIGEISVGPAPLLQVMPAENAQ
jgi:hypothetical protein